MYAFLKGKIAFTTQNSVAIDVNGIGFEVFCTDAFAMSLSAKAGEEVTIYTYLNVKEDEMTLFGFESLAEKNMFLNLISVNGVGPKLALTIIGGIKLDDLISAIVSGNSMMVNSVKGVGKKTAEKIIIELRDKINKAYPDVPVSKDSSEEQLNGIMTDAVATLVALGYKDADAIKAVKKAYTEGITLTQLIHKAMRG